MRTGSIAICTIAFVLGVGSLCQTASEPATYVDDTQRRKISFHLENSPTSRKYLPETMGGGVAVFDYDNDGRLDIFFVNGARIDDPMGKGKQPDKSAPKYWNRLYHQNDDGTFFDGTEHAGLTGMPQNKYGMGVAVGDYDNNGFEDLYVTGVGGNTLYHNNGDGTFADVTAKAGVASSGWGTSTGFFDYDNDGNLDIFVCRYLEWSFAEDRYCGERRPGGRSYCHPDSFPPITNVLFHNNGNGTFSDVSEKTGIANPLGKSLGVTFADYNSDGWTDIYIANDSVPCFLYRNNRNGTFTNVAVEAGVAFNEDGQTFAGMGTDFADYDNDGRPDIFVTDLSNQRYVLFHNNGDNTFSDATVPSGVGSATIAYSGWSTRFIDYDNDGWKDLFVAQGHVMDNIEVTSPNLRYLQPPLLLKNLHTKFVKVEGGAGLKGAWAGRGAAFGDLDGDGRLDVVVTNIGQDAYLLRNQGASTNGWIRLELQGTRSNRDGIGCRIKVVAEDGLTGYYTVNTGAGYLSASDKHMLIGLGRSNVATTVDVIWPSGITQRFERIKSGGTLRAVEPAPAQRPSVTQ